NVYGAGNATTITTVAGDINVTLSKNAVVGGSIYGSDGNATVKGIKTFSVKEYVGSISVNNFDKIEISADSKVEFANAFDVETLVVEVPAITLFSTDAQVTLADGTTFDTLTLVGDFEQNQINLNTVFGDSAGVVLSALEDKTALTVIDSNGQEWATENLSSENGILSFEKGAAIPEPSTYAAIFGAIALGFVAYRRRK
ncbi:MAG: PEP-CTERM sorting domain-containing protein, partial [Opitutales bacterium]|nr:PEP-CTERM sorting domain-containing protein [Opitutales bacterium]